jgi:EAL domain-containing protein (putative c-di-GMP-specific phosphodiesterase class I)
LNQAPSELTTVDDLLRLVRDQLGMQVAILHKHVGSKQRVRNLQTKLDLPIHRGYTDARADGFGQLLMDGQIPAVIGDTGAFAVLRDHAATKELHIGCHVGIALHRADGTLYGTLSTFSQRPIPGLRQADADVLAAVGPILMRLVEQEEAAEDGRHAFISRLDSLHDAGGPAMVYQPLFDLARLEPVGNEALSRFPAGTPSPAEWFRGARDAGLGVELELAALSNAFAHLDDLAGFLSVNVSPETACSPKFADLPVHRVVIELTEHAPIEDYDTLNEALEPLRRDGLRVAIDDAGAGYASMRHILSVVPDFIKLDLSLVRGIDRDLPRQALAAALAAFAYTTDALVVAEGIETATELATLERLGIHYGQGYHLARPSSPPSSLSQPEPVLPA